MKKVPSDYFGIDPNSAKDGEETVANDGPKTGNVEKESGSQSQQETKERVEERLDVNSWVEKNKKKKDACAVSNNGSKLPNKL